MSGSERAERALAAAEAALYDQDDPEGALEALRRERAALAALTGERLLRGLLIEAEALAAVGEPAEALARHEQALALDPEDLDHLVGRGQRRLDLARFDEARQDLERARAALGDDDPGVLYGLAVLEERAGRQRQADRLYAAAARLDPEGYPAPIRLSDREFDRAVEEALASLPPPVRAHLGNVVVAAEPVPPERLLRETGHDPFLLGLYEGRHVGEEQAWGGVDLPPRITLYRRNIERAAADRDEVVDEIRTTVLHEVGHHIGFDEDGLDRIGLA